MPPPRPRSPSTPLRPRARPAGGRLLLAADGVPLWACHDEPHGGGRAVAVVLVHGFTQSGAAPAARSLVAALRRRAGVVSLDLRGHGASGGESTVGDAEALDVDAAVAWARLLGYRRVVTLGFSLGAACVLRHAGLLAGAASDPDASRPGAGGDRVTRHPVDAVAAVSGPSRWGYRGTVPMRRLHRGITNAAGRAVVRAALSTRVAARGWDPWPAPPDVVAGAVRVPLLVVHGGDDAFLPVEHARWLAAAAPSAELWLEAGMGHAEVAVDADLAGRLARWLAGPGPDGGLPGCGGRAGAAPGAGTPGTETPATETPATETQPTGGRGT